MTPVEVVLHGDGVVLRPYRAEDTDDLITACNDPLVRRFVPSIPSPYTRTRRQGVDPRTRPGRHLPAATWPWPSPTRSPIGWWAVAAAYAAASSRPRWATGSRRGPGVGAWPPAVTRALTAHAFAQGVQRLTLRTEPENTSSQRVALAAGFTREGVQRYGGANRDGTRHDLIVWARLHDDPAGPTRRVLPDLPGHDQAGGGELTDGVVALRPLGAEDADDTYALRASPTLWPRRCRRGRPSATRSSASAPGQRPAGSPANGPTSPSAMPVRAHTQGRSAFTTGSRQRSRP